MKISQSLPNWSIAVPIVAWLLLGGARLDLGEFLGSFYTLLLVIGLLAGVLATVFHAEVVAHRVGEPYGTLVLAVAATAIEAALIVSLMIAGGEATTGLARDTVYAAVMIILNGMVGLCLLAGEAHIPATINAVLGPEKRRADQMVSPPFFCFDTHTVNQLH